jgi:hypothetical protein
MGFWQKDLGVNIEIVVFPSFAKYLFATPHRLGFTLEFGGVPFTGDSFGVG